MYLPIQDRENFQGQVRPDHLDHKLDLDYCKLLFFYLFLDLFPPQVNIIPKNVISHSNISCHSSQSPQISPPSFLLFLKIFTYGFHASKVRRTVSWQFKVIKRVCWNSIFIILSFDTMLRANIGATKNGDRGCPGHLQ